MTHMPFHAVRINADRSLSYVAADGSWVDSPDRAGDYEVVNNALPPLPDGATGWLPSTQGDLDPDYDLVRVRDLAMGDAIDAEPVARAFNGGAVPDEDSHVEYELCTVESVVAETDTVYVVYGEYSFGTDPDVLVETRKGNVDGTNVKFASPGSADTVLSDGNVLGDYELDVRHDPDQSPRRYVVLVRTHDGNVVETYEVVEDDYAWLYRGQVSLGWPRAPLSDLPQSSVQWLWTHLHRTDDTTYPVEVDTEFGPLTLRVEHDLDRDDDMMVGFDGDCHSAEVDGLHETVAARVWVYDSPNFHDRYSIVVEQQADQPDDPADLGFDYFTLLASQQGIIGVDEPGRVPHGQVLLAFRDLPGTVQQDVLDHLVRNVRLNVAQYLYAERTVDVTLVVAEDVAVGDTVLLDGDAYTTDGDHFTVPTILDLDPTPTVMRAVTTHADDTVTLTAGTTTVVIPAGHPLPVVRPPQDGLTVQSRESTIKAVKALTGRSKVHVANLVDQAVAGMSDGTDVATVVQAYATKTATGEAVTALLAALRPDLPRPAADRLVTLPGPHGLIVQADPNDWSAVRILRHNGKEHQVVKRVDTGLPADGGGDALRVAKKLLRIAID